MAETSTLPEDLIWRRFSLGHAPGENGRPAPLRAWSQMRSRGPVGVEHLRDGGPPRPVRAPLPPRWPLDRRTQVLDPAVVRRMQSREVEVPPTLVATWWEPRPYCIVWDSVEVWGHSGTQLSGSSFLLWAPERRVAIATTVNIPNLGYPFAQRVFRALFPEVVGVAVPEKPRPPGEVTFDAERFVGTYEMTTQTYAVSTGREGLVISGLVTMPDVVELAPWQLIPLTPTTFLPTDPAIDGRRGWALAFVVPGTARRVISSTASSLCVALPGSRGQSTSPGGEVRRSANGSGRCHPRCPGRGPGPSHHVTLDDDVHVYRLGGRQRFETIPR
jgi:hypothetical protein